MKTITCLACAVLALGCLTVNAGDTKRPVPKGYEGIAESTPPEKIDWENVSQKQSVKVYVNKNGTPTEVYVCAQVPISTKLPGAVAENFASRQAEMQAKARFAIWMRERLAVKNDLEQKTLVVYSNSRENAEQRVIDKQKITQTSDAFWRGMSVYRHKRMNGRYTVVWRWSATEQRLAKIVEMLTRDGSSDSINRKVDMKVKEFDWN